MFEDCIDSHQLIASCKRYLKMGRVHTGEIDSKFKERVPLFFAKADRPNVQSSREILHCRAFIFLLLNSLTLLSPEGGSEVRG